MVNLPVPDRAVVAVIVPLFVSVTLAPVTVNVAALIVPLFANAPVTVSRVADVKVPLFV